MEPHNADDNETAEPTPESGREMSRRKRGLLFGGAGAVLVVAMIAVAVVVTADPGEQRADAAAQATGTTTTTSRLSVARTSASSAPSERAQPPGSVRLPDGATARLVKRGLTEDGTLPIPQDLDKATWWGAGLGESGAMLLSGHVNWKGQEGPFRELLGVESGERVVVLDNSGNKWTYRINTTRKVSKEELPSIAPELFKQTGEHRLVLVTCGGEFVGGSTGYSSNVIAIAEPVSGPH